MNNSVIIIVSMDVDSGRWPSTTAPAEGRPLASPLNHQETTVGGKNREAVRSRPGFETEGWLRYSPFPRLHTLTL